jgi:hypothetical protein
MSEAHQDIIPLLNKELSLELPTKVTMEELQLKLSNYINQLINSDFEKLVFYLYRIDVNETKMKQLLQKQGGENAAGLIAQLIIDRQLEKLKARAEYKSTDADDAAAERW